jgi:dihydroxy-acid dehydratase
MIEIDIPRRKLSVDLTKSEISKRLKKWKPPEPKMNRGFLGIYQQIVGSASEGARLGEANPTRRSTK